MKAVARLHKFLDWFKGGPPPSFSVTFSKGDNFGDFQFAYLEDKVFPRWGHLLNERISPIAANSFFFFKS